MVTGATGVEDLLRDLAPQVLGVLVLRYQDFTDAEDAVQEALLAAANQWPSQGVPGNPRGWLITVAARRLADMWRSDSARQHRETLAAATEPATPAHVPSRDDSLLLLFMCCHPTLAPAAAIPLALRAVGGLSTAEIARAFLLPDDTIAKRITRAKQRLKTSGLPLTMPGHIGMTERLPSVLHVLYLIFNEGYAASTGPDVARSELSNEAIRLTRKLHTGVTGHPEVTGLLALMLLTDARRPARTGPHGELIPLSEQDRNLWDRKLISEGQRLLAQALPQRAVGYYQIQAAIAAVHDEAPTAGETDWPQVVALYGLLERMTANPMVTLNRAIATAMVQGPATGLSLLTQLDEPLAGHHRLHAVRAHLQEMAGDTKAAITSYRTAAWLATSIAERHHLTLQAARLATGPLSSDRKASPPEDSSA